MAFGSESRRQRIIESVRRHGPFARYGDRSALETALAAAEFDLAAILMDDHSRQVVEDLPPLDEPYTAFDRGALLSSGSNHTLARNAVRCTGDVFDVLSSAVSEAMVPDDAFTDFIVEVLEALPLTTLPERDMSYIEHHSANARIAMTARHLCPDPLPERAAAAWQAAELWAVVPPTLDEREAVYQAHLNVDWPEAHDATPQSLALMAGLQVVRGWGVTDYTISALFGSGDNGRALAAVSALELATLPAGPDPIPTPADLADFDDVALVHILSQHLARACFQSAIAHASHADDAHPWTGLVAPEDRIFTRSSATRHRRAGERALTLAHYALEHSDQPGQLRAHTDAQLSVATAAGPRDIWPLLQAAFSSARETLPNEAQSPMWKIPTLLFGEGDSHPADRVVTREMARQFCGLP